MIKRQPRQFPVPREFVVSPPSPWSQRGKPKVDVTLLAVSVDVVRVLEILVMLIRTCCSVQTRREELDVENS